MTVAVVIGRNPLPVRVTVVSYDPTAMMPGAALVMTGSGLSTARVAGGVVVPAAEESVTVTSRYPAVAWSATVSVKVSVVELT